MKKLISIILVVMLSVTAFTVMAEEFTASGWAMEEVTEAASENLIPDILMTQDLRKNITRGEFAAIAVTLYEKLTESKAVAGENPFKDISANPCEEYIVMAYGLGITTGTSEDSFSPDKEITREQMATMLTRAYSSAGVDVTVNEEVNFADNDSISTYAKDSVKFMAYKGIINGVGENKFSPKTTATREQAVLISYRSSESFKEKTANTVGTILEAEFKKIANDTSAIEIAEVLMFNPVLKNLQAGIAEIREGEYLLGFGNTQIMGYKEGAFLASIQGGFPFSCCIFVLENEAMVDGFISVLKESADPNFGAEPAEEMIISAVGNKVFFVMCPKSFN